MDTVQDIVTGIFGFGKSSMDLDVLQMVARAVVIYLFAIALIRLGSKRFMGRMTAFDVFIAIVLGSTISRAVTGQSAFLPTLAAGSVFVAMHWLFGFLALRSPKFGDLIKGRPRVLVRDGRIIWEEMRRSHISEQDLLSALRRNGGTTSPEDVGLATLERGDQRHSRAERPKRQPLTRRYSVRSDSAGSAKAA